MRDTLVAILFGGSMAMALIVGDGLFDLVRFQSWHRRMMRPIRFCLVPGCKEEPAYVFTDESGLIDPTYGCKNHLSP